MSDLQLASQLNSTAAAHWLVPISHLAEDSSLSWFEWLVTHY